jgi:hypothetical protein
VEHEGDARLHGQQRYLTGEVLEHRRYEHNPANSHWDHDHCEFCQAKIMANDRAGALHQGYRTGGYRWICEPCFEEFKHMFAWKVIQSSAVGR